MHTSQRRRTRRWKGSGRMGAAEEQSRVALLAAEAFSLVVRACSRRVGMQALGELAGGKPRLLVAAAGRCGQVDELDRQVQTRAARLLQETARRLGEHSEVVQTPRVGGRRTDAAQPLGR